MQLPVVARESLTIAVKALRANLGRGALTTLGIVIGIVAVVTTMTAVNGLQNRFRESLSLLSDRWRAASSSITCHGHGYSGSMCRLASSPPPGSLLSCMRM